MLSIVVSYSWPGKSADELWNAAVPLVDSDEPADWDRAWDEYLDPLSRKHADRYVDEVAAAKQRIRDRKELLRAVAEGAKPDSRTGAERGYLRGLRLAQAGEATSARNSWQAVVIAFGPVESESRWVVLAKAGLAALERNPRSGTTHDRTAFNTALAHAKSLSATEREAVLRALEELARDDAAILEMIREAKNHK